MWDGVSLRARLARNFCARAVPRLCAFAHMIYQPPGAGLNRIYAHARSNRAVRAADAARLRAADPRSD